MTDQSAGAGPGAVRCAPGTPVLNADRTAEERRTLVVTNTGPLVPRYEMETIFQPFRRLSGERASPDRGFGLGLSIVAAIARAHGGTVTASPHDGGGLVVSVTLPPR